ncbi:hypothetical protein F511_38756 [Dorcoceras hygrometricum]|uniref:2-oxoglutarate-dependent dioxygenase DAO n=1 Tax=Dorcoceras hygrometricum TaxID=472368 RepID=A0A2Z7BWF1_9LAMI|nr:hypothetical protein F511_38756 [Dorcoceras hygrometricum]
MSSNTIKLPEIDFSQLRQKNKTVTWESTKNHVKCALEEFGAFEATFDQIPQSLRDSVIEWLKQLFELPLSNKVRNTSSKPYHGYIGQSPVVPLYESLGIEHALEPGCIETFTNLLWSKDYPDSEHKVSSCSKTIQNFSEQLAELDQMIRKMVLESLGLEKHIDEHIESSDYVVRIQKYDCPRSGETEIGLVSHTDKNIVTIVYQNVVNGLEIMTKDGQWISPQSSPNSFVVFAGESFHTWTNGRLHAPHHRVMMKGDAIRYSIGLFSVPKDGYIIKAPEEMVDEKHPILFKPYVIAKFLDFFYSEAGKRSPNPLKEYCRV